jgi:hypothetical protein
LPRPPGSSTGSRFKRAWSEPDYRWAAGERQIVEQVFEQLKHVLALEQHRAEALSGLLARRATTRQKARIASVSTTTAGPVNVLVEPDHPGRRAVGDVIAGGPPRRHRAHGDGPPPPRPAHLSLLRPTRARVLGAVAYTPCYPQLLAHKNTPPYDWQQWGVQGHATSTSRSAEHEHR